MDTPCSMSFKSLELGTCIPSTAQSLTHSMLCKKCLLDAEVLWRLVQLLSNFNS